jgi:arylsulfatase A-like enzyme
MNASTPAPPQSSPQRRMLVTGMVVGLGYGLFEAVESYLLSLLSGGLSWRNGNSVNALWTVPVLYLASYTVITLVIVLLSLLIRTGWWDRVLLFVLASLSMYLAALNQGEVFAEWACVLLGLGFGSVVLRSDFWRGDRWEKALARAWPLVVAAAVVVMTGSYVAARLVESRRTAGLPPAPKGSPNILLLVMDTERADHVSTYGYGRPTTPHLDSLAAEATLFEWAIAPSSWTLPSHASIFTGRTVHEHLAGEKSSRHLLGASLRTLAEALDGHGYATGGFVANTYWAGRHTGLARGFLHYEDYYGTIGDAFHRTELGRKVFQWAPDFGWVDIIGRKRAPTVNQEFLSWTDRVHGRPFFAFLNYMDVHSPYFPPDGFEGRLGPRRPDLRPTRLEIGNERHQVPSPEKMTYLVDRYDECLLYLDASIGQLLDELARRGVLDHTIVIVTADHGEHLGEHGIVQHAASLYTQEIRVPLIIRYPGVVPSGVRIPRPVTTTDLGATVLDLAGLPDSFPGRSIFADSAAALSEMSKQGGLDPPEWPASKGWVRSLVENQWHFVLQQDGTVELFDLRRDPADLENLAGKAETAGLAEQFRARLAALGAIPPEGQTASAESRPFDRGPP